MEFSEYIEKNTVEKIIVEVKDELNDGYTRNRSIEGIPLLADGFKPEGTYSGDCTVNAYLTVEGKILVHFEYEDGGTLKSYADLNGFLESDEPENVKSGVAAELEIEYVESVEA